MKQIIFTTDPDEFIEKLLLKLEKQINTTRSDKQSEPAEKLLSRKATASLLNINLSTLWAWQKKSILPTYSIGNRIYFKRSDIDKALIKIN